MRRLLLALLLVLAAGLLIPPLRQPIQPEIDRFREATGQALEGPLSPILTPYRTVKTRTEISGITSELVGERNFGVPRPAPTEFQEFIRRHVADEDGLDYWGSPYILSLTPDSLGVVSAGADLEYSTEDDIVVMMRYAAPRRRRR